MTWYYAVRRRKPTVKIPVVRRKSQKLNAPVGRGGSMSSNDSKIEKVQTHFEALSSVSSALNSASDELTKVVSILDEGLKKFNIGLTVWVTYCNHAEDLAEEFDNDQLGYCKVNGKWGIALQRVWGDYGRVEFGSDGPWLFNDAPRDMRLKSVDKIPELIEALGKEAFETTRRVQQKTAEVRALADVIQQITKNEKTGPTPPSPYLAKVLDPSPQPIPEIYENALAERTAPVPPYAKAPAPKPIPPYAKALDPTPKPASVPPYVKAPSKDKEGVK
jgi:hypothetical protein